MDLNFLESLEDDVSTELVDFRGRLTKRTDNVLFAVSRKSGRDKSDLVRAVMDGWAAEREAEARLILRMVDPKGSRTGEAGA